MTIRLLTYTTLYPNAAQPRHGIFVEHRLRQLVASGGAESRVVAPVPWFPSSNPRFGRYAEYARVPDKENRSGIDIIHPRYPLVPKLGMTLAPVSLAASTFRTVRAALRAGYDFDVIDAHYFYPDGVAAVMIARRLNKPVVITARGTDINLIPRYALPRRMIRWAAAKSAGIITVCQALADALVDLGVDPAKVTVLRNGVDLELFQPGSRDDVRRRLGIEGPVVLSVGHLIERKGHHLVIDAIASLPDVRLYIAGDGEMEAALRDRARHRGVAGRVHFLGALDQQALCDFYRAVDALVLASSREGMANVLLESIACGTPVVATAAWGTPEVIASPEAGVLVEDREAGALADGIRRLLAMRRDPTATRRYAERFGWDATTNGQLRLFDRILGAGVAA